MVGNLIRGRPTILNNKHDEYGENMTEEKLKMQSPWMIYYKRIDALFKYDNEVKVVFDEDKYEVKILVDNNRKYDAICQLFPAEKTFGNITVKTIVVLANEGEEVTWTDLFNDAFANNPVFSYAKHVSGPLGTFDYIVFEDFVAQYFSDNLFDINGMTSELYQDLAKEVFETGSDAVCFCTDILSC